MFLSKICLSGFRNFKLAEINLCGKVLIIGPNEIGKTNLIWAIRLLLDKSLSEYDREPRDCDFYALEETNEFQIVLEFADVNEPCVLARLKGKISDDDKLFIKLKGMRDEVTRAKSSLVLVGPNLESLEEVEDRYYLKVLNLNYIGSRRDFYRFVNIEKGRLLQDTKLGRSEEQIIDDAALEAEIATNIKDVDGKIPQLSYIANATENINLELAKLSVYNEAQKIVFDASSSDIGTFIGNVSLASRNGERSLTVGGDGRLNQIYLCLWAARHSRSMDEQEQVSIV